MPPARRSRAPASPRAAVRTALSGPVLKHCSLRRRTPSGASEHDRTLGGSRRLCEHRAPDPLGLVARRAPKTEPLFGLRAVSGHDVLELVPVGLRELPDAVVVLPQVRVRNRQPELPDLWYVSVQELLARLVVALALALPDVHRILFLRDRVPVELHQRAPPAVERLLDELPLLVGAVHHRQDHVAPVEDVEGLLPADLLHDPRVGRVRALEERLLADDRGRVDQPGDDADVAPGLGRVVEDVVELRLPRDQVLEAALARLAEVFDDAVDELGVADLVLHLRG